MSWDKFSRWALFTAGIITGLTAGFTFYMNDISWGATWLALAVGFLCFATRVNMSKPEPEQEEQDNNELHNLAMLVADLAVMSLQNIGRTVPAGTKEIENIEDRLSNFLDTMPLSDEERQEIADKFDIIKEKTRRNQGGRAIMRSSRL